MAELEKMTGSTAALPHPTGHAVIMNEYDWLWLQIDGNPTEGTRDAGGKLVVRIYDSRHLGRMGDCGASCYPPSGAERVTRTPRPGVVSICIEPPRWVSLC